MRAVSPLGWKTFEFHSEVRDVDSCQFFSLFAKPFDGFRKLLMEAAQIVENLGRPTCARAVQFLQTAGRLNQGKMMRNRGSVHTEQCRNLNLLFPFPQFLLDEQRQLTRLQSVSLHVPNDLLIVRMLMIDEGGNRGFHRMLLNTLCKLGK